MRVAAVLTGGVLYALSFPPFDYWPCAWLTLVPLLTVIRGQTPAAAFRYGFLYGYTSAWAVTWCFADAAAHYFQIGVPLAVCGMVAVYVVVAGVPFGLFGAASALVWRRTRTPHAGLLIAACWVGTEALRARIIGQPWGLLGYTQHAQLPLIQVAALTGVYGVSFLVVVGNNALTEAASRLRAGRGIRAAAASLALPLALLGACWASGTVATALGAASDPGARRVTVVQTNVAPALQWTPAYTERQILAHIRATDEVPSGEQPALIVWPENAVPRYLEVEPMLAAQLAGVARRHAADLLFGGPRHESGQTYNSMRLITASGRNGGHYDKRRLVLFAEEKPLGFSASDGPVETPEQFTPGSGSGILQSFVRIGVSICYEIVFPELVDQAVWSGAELLVNLSNDGWLDGGYGASGPQLLAMAVFRAVETRRYLVRANTTGFSAVIDPYGRVVGSLPEGEAGILTVPVIERNGLTPYVRFGDVFASACTLLAVAAILAPATVAGRRRRLRPATASP